MKEVVCFVGLGSNLDNPRQQVLTAIAVLNNTPHIRVLKVSQLHQTKPVGYLDQPDFINAVVKLAVRLTAFSLLKVLQNIEQAQGRVRASERYGPRTIDLDLLLYGKRRIVTPELIVPHPRMYEREFVVGPLGEVS